MHQGSGIPEIMGPPGWRLVAFSFWNTAAGG